MSVVLMLGSAPMAVQAADWPDPPERFQRLKESIGLIEKLWEQERVSFDGTS